MENILQTPVQVTDILPLSFSLGGNKYVTLKEWNGTKRVDIRRWKDGTIPTYDGASLHLDEWKIICNIRDLVDNKLSEIRENNTVDWRYHLGRKFALTVKSPHQYVSIIKFCYPERGSMSCVGLSLSLEEWIELKKVMPLVEEREAELRCMIALYRIV